ncbi:MAG TPA: Holliday junction resolvase RuvX [Vicinamibacterales bacterium]|nr:Holliday junction resolvase RuvX [Vicinamibacterales bacterium]
MRVVGIDLGLKRIGLALSDASGVIASPWKTLAAAGQPARDAEAVAAVLRQLDEGDDRLQAVVIGHPRRLDGSPTHLTTHVEAVAAELRGLLTVPIVLHDERLTSREAEAILAAREKDWRKRKEKLDAAAAAVMLQDYLDGLR